MPVVIATLQAPTVQIATNISKMLGRRFSLVDEAGAARDGTKADLEKALRDVVKNWWDQDRAEQAAKADKASPDRSLGLT